MELLSWPKLWSTNTREPWKVLAVELTVKTKWKEGAALCSPHKYLVTFLKNVGFETYCHNKTILKIMWEKS